MAKNKTKRCHICSTKLDKQGKCKWTECPTNQTDKPKEDKEK